jgi:2-polyprenyl-3-methyl-5-hydroxy-6-metoxy-1,4-benzoquinol methylase
VEFNLDLDFTKLTKRDLYRKQLEKEISELIDPKTGLVKMEVAQYVSCPLCSEEKKLRELFVTQGFPHVRCDKCGLVFVNPQVNEEKLSELYGGSKANELWLDVIMSDVEKGARYTLYERYFDKLEELTEHRTLVDVGCSIGDLIVVAERRGWKAQGFDLAQKAVEFARKERGLNVHLGKLEDYDFAEGSLPVVTMTGVLEHLNDPVGTLLKVHKLLIPGGLALIQVPNLHSLHNMILHEKSTSFDGRNHLIFFTSETLLVTLEKAGFQVKQFGTYQGVTHVLCRYLQYNHPYDGSAGFSYLPSRLRPIFEDTEKHQRLIKWLEEMGMGRSIMAIGAKR